MALELTIFARLAVSGEDLAELQLSASDCVEDLRLAIAAHEKGRGSGPLKLLFEGRVLASNERLLEAGLRDGSYVDVVRCGATGLLAHRRLATACRGGVVRIWGVDRGDCLQVLAGHESAVRSVAYARGGEAVLSGAASGAVGVWSLDTGQCSLPLPARSPELRAAACAPDGSLIAVVGPSGARLWDVQSGQWRLSLSGHEGPVWSVTFTADSKRVVTGSVDGTARVWSADSGECEGVLAGHSSCVCSVACSPDGTLAASACWDGLGRIWSLEHQECISTVLGHQDRVRCIAFSPDSERVACFSPDGLSVATASDDASVRIWCSRSGICRLALRGHRGGVYAAAFSPDGRCVASGGEDSSVRIWGVGEAQPLGAFRVGEANQRLVCAASCSPQGDTLAVTTWQGVVQLWNLEQGTLLQELRGHTGAVWAAAHSPCGRYLLTGAFDETARLWSVSDGACLKMLAGHQGCIWAVTFSGDGRLAATACNDGIARIWGVRSGSQLVELIGHTNAVRCVAFSPDNVFVATGSGALPRGSAC